MEDRTLEEDFGHAVAELKSRPLSSSFRLESRYLGEILDVTALRNMGWNVVDSRENGRWLWHDCLWFERRVTAPDGTGGALLRLATSQFLLPKPEGMPGMSGVPDGTETESLLRGEKQALAYFRSMNVFREEEGGLRRAAWTGGMPEWLLNPVEDALAECQWRNWGTFSEDLARQTEGFHTRLPPGVYPSPFNVSMRCLLNVLGQEYRRGTAKLVAKRLLVRLVRALAEEDFDPEGWAELEAYGDGRTLEVMLAHWLDVVPPESGEAARFLAYALERAGDLSAPYSASGWTLLASALRTRGFLKEAVLAMDRALASPDAGAEAAGTLFREIVYWVRHRFPGETDDMEPGKYDWLLRLLHEREEVLSGEDGYWTLLGLLLAVNGNESRLAVETVSKDLPTESDGPLQLRHPCSWQALTSVFFRSGFWVRRALAAFPEPVLSRSWGDSDLPQTPVSGMPDPAFLDPVGQWNESEEVPAWASRTVAADDGEWHWLAPTEMAPGSKGPVAATSLCVFREEGAEIELFRVRGARFPPIDDGQGYLSDWERHFALANPRAPNLTAVAWECFPYDDNACGEIRFRVKGCEGSLTGASVWFPADRDLVPRGAPSPAYVYGFAFCLRRAAKCGPIRLFDGREVAFDGSRCMWEHPESDSKALYDFHAEVLSVRRVKVAGGGEVLRLDLDAGKARLSCPLPVYMREDLPEGGVPQPGDMVEGVLFLQVDFYPDDEESRTWKAAHPDGPGAEPEEEDGYVRGALVSFAKRAADGKRRIPVLDGKPDETVEIDDDTPTPETLDRVALAFNKLAECVGRDNCARWEANPDGIDLAARIDGTVHRYRVFKLLDDEPAEVEGLPESIEPLVVRIHDDGEYYHVEYEGFPEERDEEGASI